MTIVACGLSPKMPQAARVGLAGNYFGVHVVYGAEVVGMGRIIGDGGCFSAPNSAGMILSL